MQDVSALILAGGKATRFGGIAKHEIVVEGSTIFERQTRVLAPRVAEIIVSSPRPIEGYRTVQDTVAGIGPLAGIAAGLAACRTTWLLVIAGDMPHITGQLIDLLLCELRVSVVQTSGRSNHRDTEATEVGATEQGQTRVARVPPCDSRSPRALSDSRSPQLVELVSDPVAVGVRVGGLPDPLVCLLKRDDMLPIAERRIAAGDYKASRLLTDELRVRWIDLDETQRVALRNVNSPEDL